MFIGYNVYTVFPNGSHVLDEISAFYRTKNRVHRQTFRPKNHLKKVTNTFGTTLYSKSIYNSV